MAAPHTMAQQPQPTYGPSAKLVSDERRRAIEHEQLQREIDKGERCGGGAEDVAVFVSGRGIDEWGDDGWLGGKI
jgi:hypothetical protein